ncbi:histidine kinase dimerization/phosphoacceptor domain -containing protein [Polaribacter sp. Q13]|uniref:histidine kinase dimerization/phosphoacceptor domain -containing protein n=1 Tax=Polaribacter sp. Q13 TaxID=2806551 RepID=UPI00193AE9DF|nr:histidine kinase dimerization/phosphoacceptor domain -containing protein [Polaribacter sp. Q13]QVY64271.1 hypothetical protein JOP69_10870 [Polaribacter sp. Q13]
MMLWSQRENTILSGKNTFSSRDGYVIFNPYYSIYDTNDWLWILGENKLSSEYVFGEKEVIIQRFDGANFFTLKIPNTFNKKIKEGHFFRHKEFGLYLKLYYTSERAELFYINTETLAINLVEEYASLNEKYIISKEYYVNDKTRLLLTSQDKFYSAELEELNLKFIDSISFETPIVKPFLEEPRTTDKFSIVKLLFENEGFFLDENGRITKKISQKDFINKEGISFFPKKIHNVFKNKDVFYYYLDDYKNAFKFEEEDKKFIEIPNTNSNSELIKLLDFNKDYNEAYLEYIAGNYEVFKFYSFNNFEPELINEVKIKNFSKKSFKDFGKDLVVLSGNTLESYFFKESKIKTFLKEKSVRTIKQLTDSKYIVATDNEGVYIVDIKNNTEKKIQFLLDNKEITINFSRDIYLEKDNTIIINDSNNLYTLDANYNVIKDRSTRINGEEIIKLNDTIFTANQNGGIFKYSITGRTYTKIENSEVVKVKEFATNGEKIFATTTEGIFEYENGTFKTYKFENENDLLSITFEEGYGVLVSTNFGTIFKYDTVNKKLNLFYEDELKGSIVGMIADNNKNLWLNTYTGVVSINYASKKVVRFTQKDGVYELEGNRYSSYKDSKGNVLMGSYKGLSFFNPEVLVESNLEAQPEFTSISFFDAEENRWKINTSPKFLKNTKEIVLPSEYQRFSATMSVFGKINPKDVRYRYRLLDNKNKSEWFTKFSGNEILFANLKAGEYILQIEALNGARKKIGKTLELRVISKKVFYKAWWFLGLLSILLASIVLYLFYQYKERQNLYAKNEIALNEAKIKTAMMLEIHHRIKNNLQIISGLLGLQIIRSNNEELKAKLQDSQNRIESIAGIHNVLYSFNNQDVVFLKENIENIIIHYKTLFPLNVKYRLNIDNSTLNMDKATPLSLLLNELINNSNKHAFANVDCPEITIKFMKKDEKYLFEYFDNGNFIEKERSTKSMGMKIIGMMKTQLKGDMNIENANGFKLTLHF